MDEKQVAASNEESLKFQCYLCNLYANYDYYGHKPMDHFNSQRYTNKEKLLLLEDCYICADPFSDFKSKQFLILGAKCSICTKEVCVSNECSLFYYKKRFCMKCALNNLTEFPDEIKKELSK